MGILWGQAARQDEEYRGHWRTHADRVRPDELVWAVLGDSAAVGVGAAHIGESYVSQVATRLEGELGRPVRVVNLAVSGATAATVLAEQVPRLADVESADAVTCVVGGNDVAWPRRFRIEAFAEPMEEIARRLPAGSTLGLTVSFWRGPWERRARLVNAAVRDIAARHGHGVADIYTPTAARGPRDRIARLSQDRFHPNGTGYEDWADAVHPEVLRQFRESLAART